MLLLIMMLISTSSLILFEGQMAYAAPTRLYFSASSVNPNFDSWGYTAEAVLDPWLNPIESS